MLEESKVQLAVFKIGSESYAIEIENIKEVVKVPSENVYSLPNVPDYIFGLYNLRGLIIPLIDLGEKFNIKSIEDEGDNFNSAYLIVKLDDTLLGIRVDAVLKIISLTKDKIKERPSAMNNSRREYIKGIVHLLEIEGVDEYLIVLDIEKIFNTQERALIPVNLKA